MTIQQVQQLSELTKIASFENDIDSLISIYKVLQNELKLNSNEFGSMGIEWFISSMTFEQWDIVSKSK